MLSFCTTAFLQARTSGHHWNNFYCFHLAFNPRDLYYRGYKKIIIITLLRCLVTWHFSSPWLHGLMICTKLCIMLIFKLSREHIYRGLKIILISDLGRRITQSTDDLRESAFLFQRLSVLFHCYNAAAVFWVPSPTQPPRTKCSRSSICSSFCLGFSLRDLTTENKKK